MLSALNSSDILLDWSLSTDWPDGVKWWRGTDVGLRNSVNNNIHNEIICFDCTHHILCNFYYELKYNERQFDYFFDSELA